MQHFLHSPSTPEAKPYLVWILQKGAKSLELLNEGHRSQLIHVYKTYMNE